MEILVSRLCLDGGGAVFFGGLLPHRGLACRRLAGELEVVRLGLFELLGRTFHILLVAIGLRLDVAVVLLRLLPVGARRLESVRVVRVRVRIRVKSGLLITRGMQLSSRKPAGSYQLDL